MLRLLTEEVIHDVDGDVGLADNGKGVGDGEGTSDKLLQKLKVIQPSDA